MGDGGDVGDNGAEAAFGAWAVNDGCGGTVWVSWAVAAAAEVAAAAGTTLAAAVSQNLA